jgi:RimJ/RimL family protein N-acetyltransferase
VITGASNLKSQNMLERMGFTAEGRLRQRFPNEDAIVYGMLSNECKWIR